MDHYDVRTLDSAEGEGRREKEKEGLGSVDKLDALE